MLISLMQVPSVGVPNVRHKSLIPQGEAPYCEIFPNCGSWFQGWGFWQDHDSDSPTHLNVALLSFVADEMLGSFQVFFGGIVLNVAIDLVFVGKGEFKIFLHYHLEPPLYQQFLVINRCSILSVHFLHILK